MDRDDDRRKEQTAGTVTLQTEMSEERLNDSTRQSAHSAQVGQEERGRAPKFKPLSTSPTETAMQQLIARGQEPNRPVTCLLAK